MADIKKKELTFDEVVRKCTEIQLNGIVRGEPLGSSMAMVVQYVATWAYANGVKDTQEKAKKAK